MKTKFTVFLGALLVAATAFTFQNCSRAKFKDPDPAGSAFGLGLCQVCSDSSGSGIQCRASTNQSFGACIYESCVSGMQLQAHACIPVVCEAHQVATCAVAHGQGRRMCNSDRQGYSPCEATECEAGYSLQAGECVADTVSVCTAGVSRDCSTASQVGTETCNVDGSGYGACVFGDCKAGYYKDENDSCVAQTCEPATSTSCTEGAAVGFKTCNSQGSDYGSCVISGCQQGYVLKDGVCVVKVCTPGEEAVCEFGNGSGVKLCNNDGTDYGTCTLLGCQHGHSLNNGKCLENVCEPASKAHCVGESGSGYKYCFENGQGHGGCQLTTCDEGFKLKNGLCVGKDTCDDGETLACTGQNGTGVRKCNTNSHIFGGCEMTACNTGYELTTQGGSAACKKSK